MLNHRGRLWEGFLDLLFPPSPRCWGCNAPGGLDGRGLCRVCVAEMSGWKRVNFPCRVCGRLMDQPGLCRRCGKGLPPFVVARAAGPFRGCLKNAVTRLKFAGRRELAKPLGDLLATVVAGEPQLAGAVVVVPVPLAPARLAERGYNQAVLLARRLAWNLNLPVDEHSLVRLVHTPPQAALNRPQRLKNLQEAFRVSDRGRLQGRHVLLVDDILTTGATAAECCRALLRGGAGSIGVVTVATAMEHPFDNKTTQNMENMTLFPLSPT